jgi:hypothetical protein
VERNAAEALRDAFGGAFSANCGADVCVLNVTDTSVVDNRAKAPRQALGGGFYIEEHRGVKVARSRISHNTAEGNLALGGGLALSTSSVAEISDTELVGNVAENGTALSAGGAMDLAAGSEATLERVVVRDNSAVAGGTLAEGGAFSLDQSSLVVSDSVLLRNAALRGTKASRGGLISLVAPSRVRIVACAILENSATSSAPGAACSGGAIYAGDGASHLSLVASRVRQQLRVRPHRCHLGRRRRLRRQAVAPTTQRLGRRS